MIWRFGKKQLSDVVKVQQFLEKEGIEHELLLDQLDIQVGSGTAEASPEEKTKTPPAEIEDHRIAAVDADPLWRASNHQGCAGKGNCTDISHYGGVALT